MNHELVNWKKMNTNASSGASTFEKYCYLIGDCYSCNPKVRMLCNLKRKLTAKQEKIIYKELNKRP